MVAAQHPTNPGAVSGSGREGKSEVPDSCWSSCWTASAASHRICTLSTGAAALRCIQQRLLNGSCAFARQPGHQSAAPDGSPTGQQPPQSSLPVRPGDPLDDSPLRNCPVRDIVLTERDKQLLTELRRASAMLSLDMPRHGQEASKDPWVVTSHGLCSAASVVACSLLRSLKVSIGTGN